MSSFLSLRSAAAQVLALAVSELFPKVLLAKAAGSSCGFWADFVFPFPFQKEMLALIEERMRFIIKEKRPIKKIEMVPYSAAQLLLHRKQPLRADAARESDATLVEMVQIGEWTDLSPEPFPAHTGEIAAFKLQEVSQKGKCVRLSGAAFFEKEELKKFLKMWRVYEGHVALGKRKNLFTRQEGGWIWHPAGEELRAQLLDFWRLEHQKEGFRFLATPAETAEELTFFHGKFFSCHKERKLAECKIVRGEGAEEEGLFSAAPCLVDRAHLFCEEHTLLEEIISSLQFILKIPKIFGLKVQIVYCSSGSGRDKLLQEALLHVGCEHSVEKAAWTGVEVRLEDGLGRYWPASFLALNREQPFLVRSTFGSLERWIACLLEQGKEAFIAKKGAI